MIARANSSRRCSRKTRPASVRISRKRFCLCTHSDVLSHWGMTTGDIEAHIRDIYGVEVSDTTVSRITDKILPIAKEWQQRPLEAVYAVVFLDAIHYPVRSEGQIVKKAVYIAIGIDLDGKKDVLGMWVGENESAKFWATVTQWAQKPWRGGYFHRLYGQSDWILCGN